jgi:type I restriction enzyme, S subunit
MSVPKLRFKEFRGNWEVKKLGEISNKISDGIHSTPKYDDNGEYYFINGNNLTNNRIEFGNNTKRIGISEYLKYKSELTSQTILISINGTIGNLAFYNDEKIVLGKSACYIDLKIEENKFFVFYLFQTSSIKNILRKN